MTEDLYVKIDRLFVILYTKRSMLPVIYRNITNASVLEGTQILLAVTSRPVINEFINWKKHFLMSTHASLIEGNSDRKGDSNSKVWQV